MASSPKKQNRMLMVKANIPRFFKIILDRSIRDGKLIIPKKFVREHGNYLSSPVLLKLPNGAIWKVELSKCDDGKICFRKGWQEFADHYSLAIGHLLVFEFDHGKFCNFKVVIFDKSASEIDYPSGNINHQSEHNSPEVDATNDILDQKHKVGFVLGARRLFAKEKARAVDRASASFKPTNPFFMSVMQPSYIHSDDRITIPEWFAREHFNRKNGNAILGVVGGTRIWPIKYYMPNIQRYKKGTSKLTQGWRIFARDNQLQVGDVCAFELIKRNTTTFLVSIFPSDKKPFVMSEEPTNPLRQVEAAKRICLRSSVL